MTTAIIVAAGSSRRMGFDKVFAPLAGKPVIAHSIVAFEATPAVDSILLVTRGECIAELEQLARGEGLAKVSGVIEGGAERHLSVWNGLQALDPATDCVAIHDGARPLTTPAMITACLAAAREHGAACCAEPVTDTLKRADAAGFVVDGVDRQDLWGMQTPQVFSRDLIVEAYAGLIQRGERVTDEASALEKIGAKVALVASNDWNFKITFPRDLELAALVLAARRGRVAD